MSYVDSAKLKYTWPFLSVLALYTMGILPPFAKATTECEVRLSELVEQHYDDSQVYCKGLCGKTVAKLLEKMEEKEWDLSKATVIYVLYERNKVPPVPALIERAQIAPIASRENEKSWFYHSVLEYEGKIVDLHTGKAVSDPLPYFQRVFPQVNHPNPSYRVPDRLKEIYMRTIPASTYLSDYRGFGGDPHPLATKYRDKALDDFPIVSVRDYLNGH